MIVEKIGDVDDITLKLIGRIDTATASVLEEVVQGCLEQAKFLVLDCANLEYVSSVGLRIFLKAQKAMMTQGDMKLINVNEAVMEVLDITGFSDILTIEQ
ncbi:MAG: STAS domain-containing protein [Eggerthellaceae bacterium]|nr:STAS domain-containing protein [Eggerthellaceae bacterium]